MDDHYTFKPRDYIKFMPFLATDKGAGRLHECPLCGKKVWSAWGHADKHWQSHSPNPIELDKEKP